MAELKAHLKKKQLTSSGRLRNSLCDMKTESGGRSHIVSMESIKSGAITIKELKEILNKQGLLVVQDAFLNEAFGEARQAVREAYQTDVEPQLESVDRPNPDQDIFDIVKQQRYWASTKNIIGNKTFGYLLPQPEAKRDVPTIKIDERLEVAVQPCSAYKANLSLLCHESSQIALASLLRVTENENGMISQDSCKIFRGVLTKPHVDIYGTAESRIHRVQAMAVGPGEGKVRLCFARFSHLPKIQHLISDILQNDKFFGRSGFLAIPDKHRSSIIEPMIESGVIHVGGKREMIIWKSGVMHMEMQQRKDGTLVQKNDKKTTTERYIIGTHQPRNLSREQLCKVGYMASRGFIFHSYNNLNRNNPAGENSVHLKSTQWKKPRVILPCEKMRLLQATEGLRTVDDFESTQSPRKLHCVGVSQDPEDLFDDPIALRIFRELND